jgi:hypothetical protein
MDKQTKKGVENLESTYTAADITTMPEGVKAFVDIIGDSEETSANRRPAEMNE